jgi:hypothetical protein
MGSTKTPIVRPIPTFLGSSVVLAARPSVI